MALTGTYTDDFGHEFQQHTLAILARVPGVITRFRSVLSDVYYESEILQVVAKSLFEYVDKFEELPTAPTLLEAAKQGAPSEKMEAVSTCIKMIYADSVADAKGVTDRLIQFGQTQALVAAVLESAPLIEAGERSKVKGLVEKAMLVGTDMTALGVEFARGLIGKRDELYRAMHDEYLATGMFHLDHALGGGLTRGELGVVLAPPKRGKTSILVNIGYGGCMAGYTVVHITCEIREKKLLRRYDDRLAGAEITLKATDMEAYIKMLDKRATKFLRGKLYVKEYGTKQATPSMIASYLTTLRATGVYPDVVIIDYADLLKPEKRLDKKETRHEIAGIYEDLRNMAYQFNVAVWTASQGNKGSMSKETLTMEDFAEATEKAAIIDAGFGFSQTKEEYATGRFRLSMFGLRDRPGESTVEGIIDRHRCAVKTLALFNAAGHPISVSADYPDEVQTPAVAAGKKRPGIKLIGREVRAQNAEIRQGEDRSKNRPMKLVGTRK